MISSFRVIALDSESCQDSDGGINTNIKGTATDSAGTKTDECADSSTVKEYFCDSSVPSHVFFQTINCSYGCNDGVCNSNQSSCGNNVCDPGEVIGCPNDCGFFQFLKSDGNSAIGSNILAGRDSYMFNLWNAKPGDTLLATAYKDGIYQGVINLCKVPQYATSCSLTKIPQEQDVGSWIGYVQLKYASTGNANTLGKVNFEVKSGGNNFGTCTDSDGGENIYNYGEVTEIQNGVRHLNKDECVLYYDAPQPNGDYAHAVNACSGDKCKIMEKICIRDNSVASQKEVPCPQGCRDGACVKGTSECIDSDSGQDYYVKGKMSHGGVVLQDSCADEYNLNEFYCNKEGGSSSETFKCQLGCKDGACVKETVCGNDICEVGEEKTCITDCKKCIDSDKGKDYYVKGYVSYILPEGKGIGGEDSCDDYYVSEFYCKEDGSYEKDTFLCPYGCKDGACIPFLEKPGEIEVPEEKITSSTECAPKSCSVISEKCVGNDKITIEECKIYVRSYIKKVGFCEEVIYTNSKILKNTCSEEKTNGVLDCQGCLIDKNTCVPFGIRLKNKDVEYYCDVSKEMFQQKENKESCQNSYECTSNNCKSGFCKPICEGCLNENNICIPIGTRTETQYCDIEYSFKSQKSEDNSCNNNYECSSNLCINNKCISPSLLQRIIEWFKKLFG